MDITEQALAAVGKARDLVGRGDTHAASGRRSLPIFGTPEELQASWDQPVVREAVIDGLEIEPESVTMLFAQGRPGWGNEATAHLEFNGAVPDLGADLLAGKVVRRFKALFETGEIPTTHHNPAARSGGADR
jgi:hypothetical protein